MKGCIFLDHSSCLTSETMETVKPAATSEARIRSTSLSTADKRESLGLEYARLPISNARLRGPSDFFFALVGGACWDRQTAASENSKANHKAAFMKARLYPMGFRKPTTAWSRRA